MDDALVSGIMSVGIYRGLNALAYLFFLFRYARQGECRGQMTRKREERGAGGHLMRWNSNRSALLSFPFSPYYFIFFSTDFRELW